MEIVKFNSEKETEAAVLYCVAIRIKFQTIGRREIIIFNPARVQEVKEASLL